MTEKKYKNCQSCGMPLHKDTKGGGTEKKWLFSRPFMLGHLERWKTKK